MARAGELRCEVAIYGLDGEDKRNRGKVKAKLMTDFPGQLAYLTLHYHSPQVVTASNSLAKVELSNEKILQKASKILRSEIDECISTAKTMTCPPTIDALSERTIPANVRSFIQSVLSDGHHEISETAKRKANAIAEDIVFAASNSTFLLKKPVLLGIGVHNLTGQAQLVSELSRLGHCISYDQVRRIETAQAEQTNRMIENGYHLPLLPNSNSETVHTFFWWDNFDCRKENSSGGIHTTHGIAFQTPSTSVQRQTKPEVPDTKRRSLGVKPKMIEDVKVNPHTNPGSLDESKILRSKRPPPDKTKNDHFKWKIVRLQNTSSQTVPRFGGYICRLYGNQNEPMTEITFLPPIMRPITDYGSVLECIFQSQISARKANMKYCHITVDCGAAQKFYQIIFNRPEQFKDVIIHLGDLHGLMENFSVLGKLVASSGFEDILFQANMSNSENLRGVMNGMFYNGSMKVHGAFSEAIFRLFVNRYMTDEITVLLETKEDDGNFEQALDEFYTKFSDLLQEGLQGKLGKTPQFWLRYIDLVDISMRLHMSIQINDWTMRLKCWEEMLPCYFATNKHNYSRYASYYVNVLKNIDANYPGARQELEAGLMVCRNGYGIFQSCDGAGEQTFMRNAKQQVSEYYHEIINDDN